ncbi:hypothetical protein [Tenacibaculum amylolyticum]|uniref:hypothetical protein n=1 Tax=Tenacibaculum amylolyticum TaxID=104269 RepID=UPI003895D84D
MLGLILLYFIGKKFYELADEFEKSKWGFAILGIASYYIGGLSILFVLGMLFEIFSPGSISGNENSYSLLVIPFGLLTVYILYMYLEKKWKKEMPKIDNLIDKIGEED